VDCDGLPSRTTPRGNVSLDGNNSSSITELLLTKPSGRLKPKLVPVVPKVISGGMLKLERVQVICPACGQQVEAAATDGRVKGYCGVAKQYVDFLIETQGVCTGKDLTAETKAKISAALTQGREGRNSRGRFVKGNVPWNKKGR